MPSHSTASNHACTVAEIDLIELSRSREPSIPETRPGRDNNFMPPEGLEAGATLQRDRIEVAIWTRSRRLILLRDPPGEENIH